MHLEHVVNFTMLSRRDVDVLPVNLTMTVKLLRCGRYILFSFLFEFSILMTRKA